MHAVEPLVDETAAFGDHALPLAEIAQLQSAGALAPVSDAKAADPGKNPERGGGPSRGLEEGAHLVPAVGRKAPAGAEGDQVGEDVAGCRGPRGAVKSASISAGEWSRSSQRCSSQTALRSWLKGWGASSPIGARARYDEPSSDDEARDGPGPEQGSESVHSASRRRTDAAAWVRPWVRLTRVRSAPSARRRAEARGGQRQTGGSPAYGQDLDVRGVDALSQEGRGRTLGGQARGEAALGIGLRRRVGPLPRREDARRRIEATHVVDPRRSLARSATTPSPRCTGRV